jgi:hypothetical protein
MAYMQFLVALQVAHLGSDWLRWKVFEDGMPARPSLTVLTTTYSRSHLFQIAFILSMDLKGLKKD